MAGIKGGALERVRFIIDGWWYVVGFSVSESPITRMNTDLFRKFLINRSWNVREIHIYKSPSGAKPL
jgi:hypothetical protein